MAQEAEATCEEPVLPQTPVSPVEQGGSTGEDQLENHAARRSSHDSLQRTPPPPSSSVKRKLLPILPQPEFRIQEAPASPVSISPPRQGIRDPETASIKHASALYEHDDSRRSSGRVHTPDSTRVSRTDSPQSLPFRSQPDSGQARLGVDDHASHRGNHSPGLNTIRRIGENDGHTPVGQDQPVEDVQGLQYHAFDDSPRKHPQDRVSHRTVRSIGSSSSGELRHSQGPITHRTSQNQLGVPRSTLSRPSSTYTLGADLRGRPMSPHHDIDVGSPRIYARDLSSSRRSPASRPTSYIDLLNNIPYNQQVAPGPQLNNASLQSAVGSAASLLDTKKTLEMYRANVKKTNDAGVQYEFAIFMINASRDASPEDGLDSAELVNEAKHILQRLSDRAYPFAQYYLGDGYFSGLFNKGKSDYDKAFPLFVAASKHGHAEAGYRAALCYEFGWGTAKAYPKAVQFYRNSASKNHPGAATRLGMAGVRGDMGLGKDRAVYRDGVKWLKRAQESADLQYNAGPYELGLMHLEGDGRDIFKDQAYAAQLLTQSAELGHVEANFLMGRAYENALYSCPRDAALSVHFYNGAATRGHVEGMMALCAWYMVGAEPVLDKDENEAYAWAFQAAQSGFPKAEYAVGFFTEMGIGCRSDPLEANVYYVRAAEKGNETAKQRLQIIRAAASGDSGTPLIKAEAKSKDLGGKEKKKFKGFFGT